MFYPTPESGARKIWRQIVWQTLQKPTSVFWRRFLAPVSGPCVRGISDDDCLEDKRRLSELFCAVLYTTAVHSDIIIVYYAEAAVQYTQ